MCAWLHDEHVVPFFPVNAIQISYSNYATLLRIASYIKSNIVVSYPIVHQWYMFPYKEQNLNRDVKEAKDVM